jgi:hypothetical protein
MGILKIPRITTAQRTTTGGGITPDEGELLFDTDNKKIYKGDGTTLGIEYTTTNTGPANTYTVTIAGVTAYTEGDIYAIKFHATNTGASTLQINSLTPAKSIVKNAGTALSANDILVDKIYILVYDGTEFQLVTLGGGTGDMTKAIYDVDDDGLVDTAEKIMIEVRNTTGSPVTRGQIVYLNSSSSSADTPEISLAANTSEALSTKTIGAVYNNSIANNATGFIVTNGQLHGRGGDPFDTSAYNVGDKLWLGSTPGSVVTSPPSAPNHAVFIGHVTRKNNTNGRVMYSIQNGFEIGELHDVDLYSIPPTSGQFLRFDGSLWKNASLPIMVGATASVNGTAGLVPAPLIAERSLYLRGDGVWATNVATGSIASGDARRLALYPTTGTGLDDTLDSGNTKIVIAPHATGREYTIDNVGAPASFVMTAGTQTIGGSKTFSVDTTFTTDIAVNGGDITTTSTTATLFNTNATTVTIGSAATTSTLFSGTTLFALGGTGTASLTATLFGNATSSGNTKAINIGTGGGNGSITNITFGSSTGGATGTSTFNSTRNVFANATSFTTGIVSTTTTQNILGNALNLRNTYDNSVTRVYSGMNISTGAGGFVELTISAGVAIPTGTLIRLSNISGTNLSTSTDYYVYGSTSTVLRLASSYSNAIFSTPITTATGPYNGGAAVMTLYASVGTGTSLTFITSTAFAQTTTIGSIIESVLTAYGAASSNPTFDLVFKTMSAGSIAAERLRVNATGTSVTGTFTSSGNGTFNNNLSVGSALSVTGTLSGASGSTLTIGGGSKTIPAATIASGNHLSFSSSTPTRDFGPLFSPSSEVSDGTRINIYTDNQGAHAQIGISPNYLAGTAMWFSNTSRYLGAASNAQAYHFHHFSTNNSSIDVDSGFGYRRGYPFFRIVSNAYNTNSGACNEIVLAIARAHSLRNFGSITSVTQSGSNIIIVYSVLQNGTLPIFLPVVNEVVTLSGTTDPVNFEGISGRVSAITAPSVPVVGDTVTVTIPGTLPSGTYVSGGFLYGISNLSSARISFETGAVFSSGNTTTNPFYPTIPALSYEVGLGAGLFSNRIGWHLFSHPDAIQNIHMCSYSTNIQFATLQTSASTITIGTANHTTTVNGSVVLAGTGETLGFYGTGGTARATPSLTHSLTFGAGAGSAVLSNSTFGSYTIFQIVQALKNIGILT